MMIPEAVVDQAFSQAAKYTPAKATSAVKKVAEAQPELFAFVMELTEDLSDDVVSTALLMLVTIARAYELGSSQPVREIDRRAMARAFRKNEAMLEALIRAPESQLMEAAHPRSFRQPHLMQLVVETLGEDEGPFTPEESGMLFLVLKTVIDALDTAAKPRRQAPQLKVVRGGSESQ